MRIKKKGVGGQRLVGLPLRKLPSLQSMAFFPVSDAVIKSRGNANTNWSYGIKHEKTTRARTTWDSLSAFSLQCLHLDPHKRGNYMSWANWLTIPSLWICQIGHVTESCPQKHVRDMPTFQAWHRHVPCLSPFPSGLLGQTAGAEPAAPKVDGAPESLTEPHGRHPRGSCTAWPDASIYNVSDPEGKLHTL